MRNKENIIAEIRRIAAKIGVSHLTGQEFARHSKISKSTVCSIFGSWNRAVEAAGLEPMLNFVPEHKEINEEDLMVEVIRLTKELRKRPSDREMQALGRFSPRPYIKRWGSFAKGREAAYRKIGFPNVSNNDAKASDNQTSILTKQILIPDTIKPKEIHKRKKVQFGEPIDFRGLRFAPINEQGVVYLFGMISKELGFLIESIRTEYPDCEGKRCINKDQNRWEHVLIEFEYRSSQFKEHGHSPDDCDLVVCWIHDWEDCPIEVLEMSSVIKHL
ncbi:MAG TPA: hypothetical protein VGA85_00455 [Dehalococcoidales bacterium]